MSVFFRRLPLWGVLGLLVSGCATIDSTKERLPLVQKDGSAFYYQCADDIGFPAQGSEKGISVLVDGSWHALMENPVDSGFHYSDGKVTLQGKGDQAIMTVAGKHHTCQIDRRKSVLEDSRYRGADLLAMGNEPGWKLELSQNGDMYYVGDYGTVKFRIPTPKPSRNGDGPYVYAARDSENSLWLSIESKPCRDTMKGDLFEVSVSLIANGKHLQGCGTVLNPLK